MTLVTLLTVNTSESEQSLVSNNNSVRDEYAKKCVFMRICASDCACVHMCMSSCMCICLCSHVDVYIWVKVPMRCCEHAIACECV